MGHGDRCSQGLQPCSSNRERVERSTSVQIRLRIALPWGGVIGGLVDCEAFRALARPA